MNKTVAKYCIELLEATLGDMPAWKADEVVKIVIQIMKLFSEDTK